MEKPSIGQQLVDLLKASVLVQALITLGVITCVMVMAMRLQPIPDWMLQVVWILLGFYFGSKVGFSQGHAHGVSTKTTVAPPASPPVGYER